MGSCATAELEPSLLGCLTAAGDDCAAVADCTRCLENGGNDAAYCGDTACPFAISCGVTDDADQCLINCEMFTWSTVGCFHGYERYCWTAAAAANDCEAVADCHQFGL